MQKIILTTTILSGIVLTQQAMAAVYDPKPTYSNQVMGSKTTNLPSDMRPTVTNKDASATMLAETTNTSSAGVSTVGITQEKKNGVEEIIKVCENRYNETKTYGNKLNNFSVPFKLKLKRSTKNYQNAYNDNFAEFTKFTNNKINLRTAYTSNNAKVIEDFPGSVNAYSSNCARFADGLNKYVDWVLSGESENKAFATIFEGWLKKAAK